MLNAGADMLQEMSLRSAWRALTARQVAKRAGLTTGSFYNYWDTQEQFVAALVEHLLDPDEVHAELLAPHDDLRALADPSTTDDAWLDIGRRHLARIATSTRFLAEIRLMGCASDEVVAKQMMRIHDVQRRAYGRLVESYHRQRRREPLASFSVGDVGEALAALTAGYAVRALAASGDHGVGDRYARAVLGTLEALSQPQRAPVAAH